jgi:hypothetical protein
MSPGLPDSNPPGGQPVEAAGGSGSAGERGGERERAAAILGQNGCGLQFGLYSELKAGMRWEYMLMSMTCNALGQPVKVPPFPLPARATEGKKGKK